MDLTANRERDEHERLRNSLHVPDLANVLTKTMRNSCNDHFPEGCKTENVVNFDTVSKFLEKMIEIALRVETMAEGDKVNVILQPETVFHWTAEGNIEKIVDREFRFPGDAEHQPGKEPVGMAH